MKPPRDHLLHILERGYPIGSKYDLRIRRLAWKALRGSSTPQEDQELHDDYERTLEWNLLWKGALLKD